MGIVTTQEEYVENTDEMIDRNDIDFETIGAIKTSTKPSYGRANRRLCWIGISRLSKELLNKIRK